MGIIAPFILCSGWAQMIFTQLLSCLASSFHSDLGSNVTSGRLFLTSLWKALPPWATHTPSPNLSLSLPWISFCVAPLPVGKPPEDVFSCYLLFLSENRCSEDQVPVCQMSQDSLGQRRYLICEERIHECKHHRLEDVHHALPDRAIPGHPEEKDNVWRT